MNKPSMEGLRRPMRTKSNKERPNQSSKPEKPRTAPDVPLDRESKPAGDAGVRHTLNPSNFLFNPGRQDSIVSLLNNYQTNGGSSTTGAGTLGSMSAGSDLLGAGSSESGASRDQRLDANAPSYYMNHRDLVMYPLGDLSRVRSDSVFLPPPLGVPRNEESVSYPARNNSIFSSMIQMPSERSSERGSTAGGEVDWRHLPTLGPADRRGSKASFDMSLWESLNLPSSSIAGSISGLSSGSLSGILAGLNNGSIDLTNMTNAERRDSILKLIEQASEQQTRQIQPGTANLKEDIFSNGKGKHEPSEIVVPDLMLPASSGSAKSIYREEPQSPGSSPQYSIRDTQPQDPRFSAPNSQWSPLLNGTLNAPMPQMQMNTPNFPQLNQPLAQINHMNQQVPQVTQRQREPTQFPSYTNQYPNTTSLDSRRSATNLRNTPQTANNAALRQTVSPAGTEDVSNPSTGFSLMPIDMYDYKRLQPTYPQEELVTKSAKEIPAQQLAKAEDGHPLLGATKVDQLMLVLQARDKGNTSEIHRAPDGSILVAGDGSDSVVPEPISLVGGLDRLKESDDDKSKKKKTHAQECPYCQKVFTQLTHLEVHVRSHIGYKPYECTYCHKRFTQGGNLRTHLRLHTGEKPFVCDVCKRSFSRKGNLEMHKLTHDKLKPYPCKLDDCGKSFTQLGNLKSHQNRFHLNTLNAMTEKVAELSGESIEKLPREERELLHYFKDLYKNSNKGIRGRGKRVSPDKLAGPVGGLLNVQFQDGYDMNGLY